MSDEVLIGGSPPPPALTLTQTLKSPGATEFADIRKGQKRPM